MFKSSLSISIAAITVAMAMPAMSQQDSGFTLEEVVVTAQKRDQSLQDVPLAITALSSDDLQRVNAQDMKDIQFSTPNLTVNGATAATQSFGIRGISDFSRNPGYDNRVGVYVDGVWAGRSTASNQSALDIQSVEVLRGPQGTLFGKNTVAGALNITTKRPTEELGGTLAVDLGNYNLQKVMGTINLPLTDNLLTKLSVSTTRRDGHVDDVFTSRDYEDKDEQAVRGQVQWNASDNTEVMFSFDHMENEFTTTIAESAGDALAPKPYEVALDGTQFMSTQVEGLGLTINHTLESGFELTSITGKRYSEWVLTDNDEDYTPGPFASSSFTEESDHISQEFRLASPEDDDFDYVLGVYFLDQEINGNNDALAFAPLVNPLAPAVYVGARAASTVEVSSFAAFAHGNYQLTDNLELTAGLRYTKEDKDLDYSIEDTSGLFANTTLKDDRSASNWSPKASLNWFVNDDIMIYGSYSKAYKSGGWNADMVASAEAIGFDDEEVDSFEIGMKSTLLDGRMRFNATVFHANYTDYQVFSFVPLSSGGTLITVSNAGEVTSQGLELDLQWMISENWRLWSAYGYTDSTFDKFENGGGPGVNYDGNATANAPEDNFSFGFEYATQTADGELIASMDYFYRGESFSNPNNAADNEVESREEVSARVGYEAGSGQWSAYLWGKNLTDETTVISSSRSFLGLKREQFNMPRTYGISVKYNFGA